MSTQNIKIMVEKARGNAKKDKYNEIKWIVVAESLLKGDIHEVAVMLPVIRSVESLHHMDPSLALEFQHELRVEGIIRKG